MIYVIEYMAAAMLCCVGRYLLKTALIEYMIYVIEYKAAAMLCCVRRYLVKGSLELSGVGARGGLLGPPPYMRFD